MATFVYGMNLSLDGFVDHERFAPDAVLFDHWIAQCRAVTDCIYGRRIYEIMQYWDEDQPGWGPPEHKFAKAWRAQHKWVVTRNLMALGPNATLISDDVAATVRGLKARLEGEVDISGTILAQSLTALGLIDEYRLYYHPVVLGAGKPFFAGPAPRLRLVSSDRIGEAAIRLIYVPA